MNRIKQLRNDLGLSLQEFGRKVGKPKSTIYRWETEERRIKAEDLKTISKKFNVSMNWLLGYDEEKPKSSNIEAQCIELDKETKIIITISIKKE